MKDLHAIASEEQTLRGAIRGLRASIATLEGQLAGKHYELAKSMERLVDLRADANAIFDATADGPVNVLGSSVDAVPGAGVADASDAETLTTDDPSAITSRLIALGHDFGDGSDLVQVANGKSF